MKKLLLAAFVLAAFSTPFFAQKHVHQDGTCGMSREMLDQTAARLLASRAEAHEKATSDEVADRGGAFKYVPVRFILVAKDDGSGRTKEGSVLDALCCLNAEYEEVGFRFYLADQDFKYLNNSGIYDLQTGINLTIMEQNDNEKAINYFMVGTPDYGANQTGGIILGYYTPQRDWLVMKNGQLNCASSTVAHETGHFFSLLHPFNGWDHDPWPAGSTACAGAIAPDLSTPTEKVSGTNALTAGDFIKDTPASYNFLFDDSNCAGGYGGGAKDPSPTCTPLAGVTMADNFMDYFEACADYKFTQGQIAQMNDDLNSSGRNFLDNTFSPIAETITTPTNMLLEPLNNATTDFYDQITFKWDSVIGATHYLLEIGVNTTMTAIAFSKLIKGTSWTGKVGISSGATRYWRITPINQYYTCSASSATRKFTAGSVSATVNIEGLSGWAVSPNPATSTGNLVLNAFCEKGFLADVEITTVSGQRVFFQAGQQFFEGENQFELAAKSNLAAGAYLVSMSQKNAKQTQKLIVID